MWRAQRTILVPHGTLPLPCFAPDATRLSVRACAARDVTAAGVRAAVINTYHAVTSGVLPAVHAAGGAHAFMGVPWVLLSDSGGYQVFSLVHRSGRGIVTEAGVRFRHPRTGAWTLLTPERAIAIQAALGTDLMVVLDDPLPAGAARAAQEAAVARTVRWARRCRRTYARLARQYGWTRTRRPLLCAVVQGGPYSDLRRQCCTALTALAREEDDGFGTLHWDAYGFGGRHVREDGTFLADVVRATAAAVPRPSITFALGVGAPQDIVRFHAAGWELFDCVMPTREGRHGRLFCFTDAPLCTAHARWYAVHNLRAARYATDRTPIALPPGQPPVSRAYVHHLLRSGDPLGGTLLSLANLTFYTTLLRRCAARCYTEA